MVWSVLVAYLSFLEFFGAFGFVLSYFWGLFACFDAFRSFQELYGGYRSFYKLDIVFWSIFECFGVFWSVFALVWPPKDTQKCSKILQNARNARNIAKKPPGTKLAKIDFSRFFSIFSILEEWC